MLNTDTLLVIIIYFIMHFSKPKALQLKKYRYKNESA